MSGTGPLDERTRRPVKLGIAIGAVAEGAVRSAARKALEAGATEAELEQVRLLAGSTRGFPSAIAALGWVREVFPARPYGPSGWGRSTLTSQICRWSAGRMTQKTRVPAVEGEDSSTAVVLPWPTSRATHGASSGGGGVVAPAHAPEADDGRRHFLTRTAAAIFGSAVAIPLVGSDVMTMDAEAAEGLAVELAALPEIPAPVPGQDEDPVVRMMRDVRRALAKPLEKRRWVMVIDERKCTGCQGCTIACIQENKLPPGVVYRPVIEEVSGTYPAVTKRFIPRPCMQCDDPPCVPVCPVSATWLRADGIVEIDYQACIGCRYCLTACPYNARTSDFGSFYGDEEGSGGPLQFENVSSFEYGKPWNREGDESPIGNARKCHFCLHRITDGLLPACVLSCMGRATYFGDSNDPESLVSELISQPNASRLKEEAGTNPKVYYLS